MKTTLRLLLAVSTAFAAGPAPAQLRAPSAPLRAPVAPGPLLQVPGPLGASPAPLTLAPASLRSSPRLRELGQGLRSGRALPARLGRTFDGLRARPSAPLLAVSEGRALAPAKRRLEDIRTLRVGTFNVLNLFEHRGKFVPDDANPGFMRRVSEPALKPAWQLEGIAAAVRESELDVLVLQEVENIEALSRFSRDQLQDAYVPLLIEGNDGRGIDVGFLVKRDLPFELEHRTHKDERWDDPVTGRERPLFSRDLPALVLRAEGRPAPLAVLLGTHLKSKRDRPGDPESRILRKAQAERTAEIVGRYQAEFGEDLPLLVAGDFNGELHKEPEFEALFAAGLKDTLDVAGVPEDQRTTHTWHPDGRPAVWSQIDAVLVTGGLAALVEGSSVYRYKYKNGKEKPIPRTRKQRDQNPSDHFPVRAAFTFQPLARRTEPRGAELAGRAAPGGADALMARVPELLTLQSALLNEVSKRSGLEAGTLSLALAMTQEGLSLGALAKIHDALAELGATGAEAAAALGRTLRESRFAGPLPEGETYAVEDFEDLAWRLQEFPSEVEIARNLRYLGWRRLWERGDPSAAGTRIQGLLARRLSPKRGGTERWLIRFGSWSGKPLLVVLNRLGGGSGAAEHLGAILRSPLLDGRGRRALLRLARKLERLGALEPGEAARLGELSAKR